jgi:hypothetical protein
MEGIGMRGWMILFAMMAVSAAGTTLTGNLVVSSRSASAIFTLLFVLGLLTRAVRGSAW